jgi:uncharacterized Zn finger protein
MSYYGWKPYVPVAQRRAKAAKKLAKLAKGGRVVAPVVIAGRTIATTFWGKAWNDNLEAYSDYSNRLPRGRTYVRNGSVLDLQINAGEIRALVSGSEIYEVAIQVAPVAEAAWASLCRDCSGGIESLVELLQGRLSKGVMERICRQQTGLFPSPKDIHFSCSCPDWASMCKHVAAVLYGVGARLDAQPELLFTLRQVAVQELLTSASQGLPVAKAAPAKGKLLAEESFADLFDLEMADTPAPKAPEKAPMPSAKKPTNTPKAKMPAKNTVETKAKAPARKTAKPGAKATGTPQGKPAAKPRKAAPAQPKTTSSRASKAVAKKPVAKPRQRGGTIA